MLPVEAVKMFQLAKPTEQIASNHTDSGMCYPVCGMVHIKEPLLLIRKSSPCGGSGFPLTI